MDGILDKMRKAGRSAFRTREYAALAGKKAYARLALHRMGKKGEIVLVRGGWWAFADALPEAIACEVSRPCYVSFHSAFFLHRLTTQTPKEIQLAVARTTRKYKVQSMTVREVKVKKEAFNNYSAMDGILLASPEKAFADCIARPKVCPLIVLVEVSGKIDLGKVEKRVASKAAANRLKKVMRIAGKERA